jgi:hypothetical protein
VALGPRGRRVRSTDQLSSAGACVWTSVGPLWGALVRAGRATRRRQRQSCTVPDRLWALCGYRYQLYRTAVREGFIHDYISDLCRGLARWPKAKPPEGDRQTADKFSRTIHHTIGIARHTVSAKGVASRRRRRTRSDVGLGAPAAAHARHARRGQRQRGPNVTPSTQTHRTQCKMQPIMTPSPIRNGISLVRVLRKPHLFLDPRQPFRGRRCQYVVVLSQLVPGMQIAHCAA